MILDPNALVQGMLIPCLCKFDLFSKDVILIPVNHNDSYWTTAAINFRRKRIELYNSTGMALSAVHKVLVALLSLRARLTPPGGVAQVLGRRASQQEGETV